jgi:hypothetical protein
MKRTQLYTIAVLLGLVCFVNVYAAILTVSPTGSITSSPTLADAVATKNVKEVRVTSALSAVQSNISSASVPGGAWPSDRALVIETGGSIGNTTQITGLSNFTAPLTQQVFTGTGIVTGFREAYPEWWGTNTVPGATDMTTAIQAALDTGSPVQLSGTNYAITAIHKISSTSSIVFRGEGADRTTITLIGDADDVTANSYNYGGAPPGTTVYGALLFALNYNAGGYQYLCDIGGFRVIGNTAMAYGLTLANMGKGSKLSDVQLVDFMKPEYDAVPLTLYRNIELNISDLTTNMTGRLIKLIGCNDRVTFERNTHYNFATTYPGIFVVAGYNADSTNERNRYPVQVIFNQSYFHGGDTSPFSSMDADDRVAFEITNTLSFTLRDSWFENVGYALTTAYIASVPPQTTVFSNNRLSISGCIRGGTTLPQILLVNSSSGNIEWDWPITMDASSQYNIINHRHVSGYIRDESAYKNNDNTSTGLVRFYGTNAAGTARPFEMANTIFSNGTSAPASPRISLSLGSGSNLWVASAHNSEYYYIGPLAVATWASATTYAVGALVIGSDTVVYQSLLAANLNNDPTVPSNYWMKYVTPYKVYANAVELTAGTAGSLADGQWDWANNDTLGYSTVYLKLAVGDPDAQATGYVKSLDFNKGRVYTKLDGSGEIYVYKIATDTWTCLNP